VHDETIGLHDFVSVAGPQGDQPRHRTQRHQLCRLAFPHTVFHARPATRLSALMELPCIFVFTHFEV